MRLNANFAISAPAQMLLLPLFAMTLVAPAPLRVLGLQVELLAGQVDASLARAEAMIRAHPARLYVLPELNCHGYSDAVLSQLDPSRPEQNPAQDAETGSITAFFARLAREVDAYICYGFLRDAGGGRTCICQAVVDPKGALVLAYDKMHLCDMGDCSEVGYGCSPGGEPGVFEVDGVRVGLTICYDIRFPELYRALAWDHECDLVLHPAAFIRDATFPMYHTFVQTRAVENGIYLLSVSYAGERFGASIACPPWVGPVPGLAQELAPASLGSEEGVLPLVLEPRHLDCVRRAYPYRRNVNPVLRRTDGAGRQRASKVSMMTIATPPPSLTVVIPAFNEALRLPPVLDASLAYLQAAQRPWELIVVDDGSTDGTSEVVRQRCSSCEKGRLRLLRADGNGGKGAALRAGAAAARGDRIALVDADGATPLSALPALERALDAAGCGVAVGSRSEVLRRRPPLS